MTADTVRAAPPATSARQEDTLAGAGAMLRFLVRRNRVRLAAWWAVLVGLFAYVLVYYQQIFDTQAALDDFAKVSNVPSIKALTGLSAAPATLGGAVWTKIWMTCAMTLAFAVLFLITRNGRADEEVGRTELLRARQLGVHASSAAAWLVTAALCVAVGAGIALASIAGGLDPQDAGVTGSLITGFSIAGVGLVAIGVGAVAGQLTSTSRAANSLGAIVLATFYVIRMMGDLGDGKLTWLSPVGWGQQMQPWGADRWWPLALTLAFTAALLLLARRLEARRDYGSGLLSERPGPTGAPARWASPLGLGIRLQRGPIIGWTIAIVLAGLLYGSVVQSMADFVRDAGGSISDLVGGTSIDALLSLLVMLVALVATVFAVQSTATLRSDEASGILEPQLAGAVSRTRWALQRLLIPAIGAALLLLFGGLVMGASYGLSADDPGQTGRLAVSALAYWPAVMVFVGVAVALFGWLPRLSVALSWAVVVAMWFVVIIGDALHLPAWLLGLLPFSATPYQPLEPMDWTPLVVMVVIAGGLVWLGLGRFARRDVQPG